MAYIFQKGSGTELDPFIIETLQDLEGIKDVDSEGLPNYENKWYVLGNDINFEGYNWIPISNLLNIHFNGMNHKLYNLEKIESYEPCYSQFVLELNNSFISNLIFDNIYIELTRDTSGLQNSIQILVGNYTNNSSIDNIKIYDSTIKTNYQTGVGLIAATSQNSSIQNCNIEINSITDTGDHLQGIFDIQGIVSVQHDSNINNCKTYKLYIYGSDYTASIGGIVGDAEGTDISNCLVTMLDVDFNNPHEDCNVGGIQSRVVGTTNIMDCKVINLNIENSYLQGGIVSDFIGDEISLPPYEYGIRNCQVFDANIISQQFGGIAGFIYNRSHIKNSITLKLNFTVTQGGGGIAVIQGDGAYIENCIQQGQVTQTSLEEFSSAVGGIQQRAVSSSFIGCGQDVNITTTTGNVVQQGGIGMIQFDDSLECSIFPLVVENCYSLSNINSFDDYNSVQAGFIGIVAGTTTTTGNEIKTSYSQGNCSVLQNGLSGGFLAGDQSGLITYINNFYDSDQSGHVDTNGQTPLTTLQIKDESNLTGFDFIDTWKIGTFTGTEDEYISDINGNYYFSTSVGNKILYIEYDPSNGYPYLQFETKKEIVVSDNTHIDLFVR